MASRSAWRLLVVLAIATAGCTAIRPLDPVIGGDGGRSDTGAGTLDVGLGDDAFVAADAGTDAATPGDDTGPTGDAGSPNDAGPTSDAGRDAATPTDAGHDTGCPTYYPDQDRDGYGTDVGAMVSCTPLGGPWATMGGDCDDTSRSVSPAGAESCDGQDEDCNGMIDDGLTTCGGCPVVRYSGRPYLFCSTTRTHDTAAANCAMIGYHLVDIADAAENMFVLTEAMMRFPLGGGGFGSGAWIGLMENGGPPPTSYTWTDGTTATYLNWDAAAGEPNFNGPCVRMRLTSGVWADQLCSQNLPYVCEAP